MTTDVQDVPASLQQAFALLEHTKSAKLAELKAKEAEVAQIQAELARIAEALKSLQGPVFVPSREYAGLGIVAATQRLLSEVGPMRTDEIAAELRSRGVTTKSRRYTPTVYATLRNSKMFQRRGDQWELTAEGRL